MSLRAASLITTMLLALLVLVRAFPFVWWSGAHFDSDQAIVGLMAKHVSEGRAWPLYYYGQNYMLAVEAYAAAPLMWAFGASVTTLKAPLVLVNIAVVALLLRLLVRDAKLPPAVASIAVLPLALPSAVLAARTTEANGGNVEPWLYVLILWWLRERPLAFGAVLGLGMLHREFTAYAAAALLLMDGVRLARAGFERSAAADRVRHWALAGVAWVAVRSIAASLQPFANGLGPGSRGDDPELVAVAVDTIGGRLCFAPDLWAGRAVQLTTDHLPRLVGGLSAPLRDYGVLSGVFSGQAGLGLWVGALTAVGLASGAWHWNVRRRSPSSPELAHIGAYLLLVGVISTLVYGFAICSAIRAETLRYNLLGIFIPVGALIMALQTWTQPAVRAGLGAAVVLWSVVNTLDVVALTREYVQKRPVDQRQVLADHLQARGVTIAQSSFRNAYHLTFLAGERVRVTAPDFTRIKAYAVEAAAGAAPLIADAPCPAGSPLPNGQYLCPPSP